MENNEIMMLGAAYLLIVLIIQYFFHHQVSGITVAIGILVVGIAMWMWEEYKQDKKEEGE